MTYEIGDNVCIVCLEKSDKSIELIHTGNRGLYDEDSLTEHHVKIIGKNKGNDQDYIALCDFDPFYYIAFKVNDYFIRNFNIAPNFLGERAVRFFMENILVKPQPNKVDQIILNKPGGYPCEICKKHIQYASPNLPNGSFICRRCKNSKMYKIEDYFRENGIDPNKLENWGWAKRS